MKIVQNRLASAHGLSCVRSGIHRNTKRSVRRMQLTESQRGQLPTHTQGGSVNAGTSIFRYEAQHGRLPTLLETSDYFHFKDGLPRDDISKSIHVSIILIFLLNISINGFIVGVFMASLLAFT